MKTIRFLQMGLGPVGLAILKLATERPWLSLVGALDPRPDLAGRDVGELLGCGTLGIAVTSDPEPLLDRAEADLALHATGSFLGEVADQIRPALRRGVSIVSTCEELAYPYYRHPALASELDALARDRGAVLLGTGVNPGFVMDKLVATLLGACRAVRRVRVLRVVDAGERREPLQRKIGAGLTLAEFEERKRTGRFGHIGLAESAHMIADVLGVPKERALKENLNPRVAERAVSTSYLRVEAGRVAGVEQFAAIDAEGVERVRLDLRMYVGAERPEDTISIDGSPPIEMTIKGGVHGDEGTAAVVVNSASLVRDLKPGLHTMLDLPIRFVGPA